MYNFLKKNQSNPKRQNLLATGENIFPYNILITNQNENTEENLIFVFKIEDAYKNKQLILDTLSALNQADISYTILLAYGEQNYSPIEYVTCGSKVFTRSLNTNIKNYIFAFDLTAKENKFITGSQGITSPSWMIFTTFVAYVRERLTDDLPFYYLSQFSKYKFYKDDFLSDFHLSGIPAIKLDFNTTNSENKVTADKITRIVEDIIKIYKELSHETNDYHSLMLRFFNKTVWFSEYTIVKIIIVIIFIFIFSIVFLGFINSNLKLKAWKQLKNNWFMIPVTLILTIAGFFAGKYLYLLINKLFSFSGTPYEIVFFELLISSAFVSCFYLLEMFFNKQFGEKSVDFLIFISTFINLFVFSILDISLFPFFLLITLFSIFSLLVKRNWTHIILEILTIVAFAPYIIHLYKFAPSSELRNFLIHENMVCIYLPLILQPVYLFLLRIFTATRKRFQKKRVFTLIIGTTYVLFFIALSITNNVLFTKKQNSYSSIEINELKPEKENISYTDKKIFGDIIRTIRITTDENPAYVELTVTGANQNPVIYSDNEFINRGKNISSFIIPYSPSENMIFSYGSSDEESTITLKTYYRTEKDNSFCFTQTSIKTGAQ